MDPETFDLLRNGAILYIILVGSIALHEWGHAYSADRLGDPLPRSQGRVTLNPLAHIDPIGTVLIPLVMIFMPIFMGGAMGFMMIGWGKPVMVSLPNRRTEVRDDLIITAAGPAMNLVISLGAALIGGVIISQVPDFAPIIGQIIFLNCLLVVFNLLPIPPLDGSHFMRRIFKMRDETYFALAGYGFIILIVLINIPGFREIMRGLTLLLASFFFSILHLVASLLG